MNPFEKIFSYAIVSHLDETATFTSTSHERAWLKRMLEHPAASDALLPETLRTLREWLASTETPDFTSGGGFLEKARHAERRLYHPLLRPLRRLILSGSGMRLTIRTRSGSLYGGQPGLPYKLEYSMVRKEWYLLWYHLAERTLLTTKLETILEVHEEPIGETEAAAALGHAADILASRREQALIEVLPFYRKELSRILYAFSCFDKEVAYDEAQDVYRIRLTYHSDEAEYVLSKLRFLGKRVRVAEGPRLQERMRESARLALARYGRE
ncbi:MULTISPECIES: WYL domain-containing protein [Paenibacillus]|uniref:WYL domain-containing protein n=1 Tax=Paenibacillus TaxID=44249 RepID=UPI0022B8F459|nr:WYL domain-containing protein [Paenibacillus caseinilyticus]MCZ8519836.1 WYL domain-containing protein [Paenibacillus caseinilyticus]